MNPVVVSAIVFSVVFGGAVFGLRLRSVLPDPHLTSDTKDVVKLAMGLVATMTALILGLLISSAKGSYDMQRSGMIQLSAKIAFLDQVLALYGPESGDARGALRVSVERELASTWPDDGARAAAADPGSSDGQALFHAIQRLAPDDDEKRALKAQAVQIATDIGQARWLLFEESGSSISAPLLIVVSAWLAVLFTSFGLFAPSNRTVIVALMVASLCVAGSIFLILELDQPLGGVIQLPSAPLRSVSSRVGR